MSSHTCAHVFTYMHVSIYVRMYNVFTIIYMYKLQLLEIYILLNGK